MVMRNIPREEWETFFDRFTRENRHKPVSVAKTDLQDGLRIAERITPLLRVNHDAAAHRISITIGEPSGEVTHTVVDPDSVAIEEPGETDEEPQTAVHLTGGGQHLVVRLERQHIHS